MHDPDLDSDTRVGPDTERDLATGAEPRDDVLMELLVRWEEAHARGEELTAEVLCQGDTRWLSALRERIAKRKRLHRVLDLPAATETGRGDGPSPPAEFPGHEVLGEIGRGGMGIVYRARDIRLGRVVALKTLVEAGQATRDQLDRFLDEARAVARLRHPNIVAIHAIGEHEGRPYFSLEYVEGGNLAQRLAGGPLSPRQAAELVESLAHSVHAAHRAGIVHRDLKPSNVLLTAEGVPKVGDFGLAKWLGSDSARTYSGQVMGTPSYMAPEQAEGRSKDVGPVADVYALGAILYHELTGRPPFLGDSALETIKLVSTTEAVPPARLRPDVPRDLETICLKCLEKSPSRRYADALSLAEDLRRFLEGRPIAARPIGFAGRLWRWAARNPMLAAAAGVVVAMFALGTPGFFVLWRGAVADRAAAVAAQGQADAARVRAERNRDRALNAVRVLLGTEWDDMLVEELRPYRKLLTDQGVREAQELVRDLEDDPQAEVQRVYGQLALAASQREAGDAEAARESGRKAIELAEALVARDPSASSRDVLGVVFHRLTGLANEPELLRAYARRSNEIFEARGLEEPDRPDPHGHAIALNDHNIGDSYFHQQRLGDAAAAFRAGVRVCQEQVRRGDRGDLVQLDLGRNLLYLSRVERNSGHLDEAVDAGRRAVAAYRAIYDREPGNYTCAIQLHLSHEELGFAYELLERWGDTIASFEASRAILRATAEKEGGLVSRVAAIKGQLARVDYNLTRAYATDPARYYEPMRATYAEAFAICDKLTIVRPLSDELRAVFADVSYQMAGFQADDGLEVDLGLYERAEQLWDDLHRRIPGERMYRAMLVLVRHDLADELAARGRAEESRACRDRSITSARGDAELLFQIAVNYAANARQIGTYPIKLDARRQQERRRMFARRAAQMLREAIADGFRDVARLWREPELVMLHDDPEFRSIAEALDGLTFPADPFAGP
ncbi:MAG: protein kinase domain-containing protein [Isosphaeraceae bacterium]